MGKGTEYPHNHRHSEQEQNGAGLVHSPREYVQELVPERAEQSHAAIWSNIDFCYSDPVDTGVESRVERTRVGSAGFTYINRIGLSKIQTVTHL